MRLTRSSGVAAAALSAFTALLLPVSARAQIRFQPSAGISNPTSDFGDIVDGGYHGRLGLRADIPLFPLSFQVEGELNHFPGSTSGSANVVGGNFSVVLSLGGIGLSPYVLGGLGYYHTSFSDEFTGMSSSSDKGFHVGFGVDIGLLGFGGFVEGRYVRVSRAGTDAQWLPVSFGVRF